MSIIEKYIQQTKDKNGNVVGFGFKGNIQNLIQEVEDLEAKCNYLKICIDKIEDIVNEPCVAEEDCKHCFSNCEHKDILNMIAKTQENLKCR